MSNIFEDEYLMYELYSFLDESDIINMKIVCKNTYKSCKNYIGIEDNGRFDIDITNKWDNSELLEDYCYNNNVIKIRKMMKMDLFWEWGLYGACEGGHINIVRLMIEKGTDDWDRGLGSACSGGHMATIQLMIEKGATDWNGGLYGACRSGHIATVQLMIDLIEGRSCGEMNNLACRKDSPAVLRIIENKGDYWNAGLSNACSCGHINIVKLMIEKGATCCGFCNRSVEEHLIDKKIEDWGVEEET